MSFIEAKGLSFTYEGGSPVLDGISFSIERGESVSVLGDNGSGKSTLLSLLDALLVPTSGTLTVDGLSVGDRKVERLIRERTGLVFQNPDSSFVTEILEDDTAFTPGCYLDDETLIRALTEGALGEVGLTKKRKNSVRTLSGGEKQRASVAGVRTMDPDIYLFDESLSFLDGMCRGNLLSIMKSLKAVGKTLIQVTHYAGDAAWSDRVIVLRDGKILKEGSPREILYDTETLESAGIVPPESVLLVNKLREAGMDIEGNPLTAEEVAGCMQKALL